MVGESALHRCWPSPLHCQCGLSSLPQMTEPTPNSASKMLEVLRHSNHTKKCSFNYCYQLACEQQNNQLTRLLSIPAAGKAWVQPCWGREMLIGIFPPSPCCCLLPWEKGMLLFVHVWQHYKSPQPPAIFIQWHQQAQLQTSGQGGSCSGSDFRSKENSSKRQSDGQLPILSCAFFIYLSTLPHNCLRNSRLDLCFCLQEFPAVLWLKAEMCCSLPWEDSCDSCHRVVNERQGCACCLGYLGGRKAGVRCNGVFLQSSRDGRGSEMVTPCRKGTAPYRALPNIWVNQVIQATKKPAAFTTCSGD